MSIATALDDLLTRPVVKTCQVADWIAAQGIDTRVKIETCLAAGISRADLHAVLALNGLHLSRSAFNNHISGRCACTPIPDEAP